MRSDKVQCAAVRKSHFSEEFPGTFDIFSQFDSVNLTTNILFFSNIFDGSSTSQGNDEPPEQLSGNGRFVFNHLNHHSNFILTCFYRHHSSFLTHQKKKRQITFLEMVCAEESLAPTCSSERTRRIPSMEFQLHVPVALRMKLCRCHWTAEYNT